MRSELKKAILRIHSDDYHNIITTGKKIRDVQQRRNKILPTWRAITQGRVRRILVTSALCVLTLFLLFVVYLGIRYFNAFVGASADLDRTQSQIESEVERHTLLIPNLAVVAAEYSAHEVILYKYVSEMRTMMSSQKDKTEIASSPAFGKLMGSLLAISEQYPNLKASVSFEQLMTDWTGTENRIAEARASHILAIRYYNGLWTRFPSNVYAYIYGYKKHTPYTYDESEVPPLDIEKFYARYLTSRVGETTVFDPKTGAHTTPAPGAPAGSTPTPGSIVRDSVALTTSTAAARNPRIERIPPGKASE